ncbi:MAG: RNA polymerase sigma factor [Candidatus Kapaibacterium sp.]
MKQQERPTPQERDADDIALFNRFLEGDDAAFMAFFNRHTPRLFLYCLKFLNNDRQMANDIMQDVWERTIRFRSEKKEPPRSPLGLVLRTAHNLCINQIRNAKHHLSYDELPEWKHPGARDGEMSEMEEAVTLALPRLPEQQREVLILHAYAGYKFQEIAEMFDESVGAIRTRAWRARVELGRMIGALIGMEENNENNGGHGRHTGDLEDQP